MYKVYNVWRQYYKNVLKVKLKKQENKHEKLNNLVGQSTYCHIKEPLIESHYVNMTGKNQSLNYNPHESNILSTDYEIMTLSTIQNIELKSSLEEIREKDNILEQTHL